MHQRSPEPLLGLEHRVIIASLDARSYEYAGANVISVNGAHGYVMNAGVRFNNHLVSDTKI